MNDQQPAAATEEELTQRCGHECLMPPDHDGIHQYGYILGPYSYASVLAQLRASRLREQKLRDGIERHRNKHLIEWRVAEGSAADERMWALLDDTEAL